MNGMLGKPKVLVMTDRLRLTDRPHITLRASLVCRVDERHLGAQTGPAIRASPEVWPMEATRHERRGHHGFARGVRRGGRGGSTGGGAGLAGVAAPARGRRGRADRSWG